jgi:hypothetical protein
MSARDCNFAGHVCGQDCSLHKQMQLGSVENNLRPSLISMLDVNTPFLTHVHTSQASICIHLETFSVAQNTTTNFRDELLLISESLHLHNTKHPQ